MELLYFVGAKDGFDGNFSDMNFGSEEFKAAGTLSDITVVLIAPNSSILT